MKKIIKNKKASMTIIWAFIYDLMFITIFVTTLFIFIDKVDSGAHYWRLYYTKDMALTLNLVEAIPDNEAISVNYGVVNRKVISNSPVDLILSIKQGSGILELINEQNHRERTKERYLTKKDSKLQIYAPLQVLSIYKESGTTMIHSDFGEQCTKYIIEPKYFINSSIFLKKTDHFNLFQNSFLALLENEYSSQIPGQQYNSLRNTLFNKNIRNSENDAEIVVMLNFIESDDFKSIRIRYFGEGDYLYLANNIACSATISMKQKYGSLDLVSPANVFFETTRANSIRYDKNPSAGVISFEFRGRGLDDFDTSHSLAQEVLSSIKQNTKIPPTIEIINELKQEHGLN
jgi:hypothetical protein